MKLPTLKGIEDALEIIRPYLPETPLFHSVPISDALNAEVWIKIETLSPIASFKLRGALVDISRTLNVGSFARVVTSSTGNHGLGVAYAALQFGLNAEIFLPLNANPVKAQMIRNLGASIHNSGQDIGDTKEAAQHFAKEHGYHFVDDGNSIDLMEGAGTVGLEIANSLENVDQIYVPLGDGALLGGTACVFKSLKRSTSIVGVQSEGAPALTNSFHARRSLEHPVNTIAEGLASRKPSPLALRALWQFSDDAILVSDDDLLAAIHTLVNCAHIVAEPAGAAALAGSWKKRKQIQNHRIVLLITGANLTMETLKQSLDAPPLFKSIVLRK